MEEPVQSEDYVGEGQQVTMEQVVLGLLFEIQNLSRVTADNTKAIQHLTMLMMADEDEDDD